MNGTDTFLTSLPQATYSHDEQLPPGAYLTCAMRWMMTSSSLAVKCALAGSSNHLRSMVRMRCRMDGSVVPARTDCPVISITSVDKKCLRWSGDRVSARGTATAGRRGEEEHCRRQQGRKPKMVANSS